jgi:hypothetical protein
MASLTDQVDLNRLRRQVAFDRLLGRLFQEEPSPWALKGGYALELRFKAARSTVGIDLTLQQVVAATRDGDGVNQAVREMLQSAAGMPLGDWFEYTIGPPIMDLNAATAAPLRQWSNSAGWSIRSGCLVAAIPDCSARGRSPRGTDR